MGERFSRDHLRVATFLSGTGLSVIGNIMAMVALPWFVLQTTGSATQTGLTGMATALPSFLSGIFGGPLVDRLGGRRMSVVADIVSAGAIFAIPALYETVGLEFWQLFALVLLGALLDVPGFTARRTLLPGFARRANMQPEAVNTSFEMLQSVSFIAGPAIAGVLIGPMGAVNLLWLTGIGFLISAVTVYGVVPEEAPDQEPNAPRLSYRQQIVEGLSFIGRDRLLLSMAVVFGVSNFLANGFHGVSAC
jgi:MFS family permease